MEYGRRAAEMESDGTHVVKLNIREPDFGAPPAFLAKIRKISDGRPLPAPVPSARPELREGVAKFSRDHFGSPIEAERVVVTTGASAALVLACAALIDPGDEVLVADPSYPCNRSFASAFPEPMSGCCRPARSGGSNSMRSSSPTRGPSGLAVSPIASPSNPTGTSMSHDELGVAPCATSRRAVAGESSTRSIWGSPTTSTGVPAQYHRRRSQCDRGEQFLQVLRHDRVAARLGGGAGGKWWASPRNWRRTSTSAHPPQRRSPPLDASRRIPSRWRRSVGPFCDADEKWCSTASRASGYRFR